MIIILLYMKNIKLLFSAFLIAFVFLISNTAQATKWVVNVQNFSFSPSALPNVLVGDTIRWVWIGGIHTTTSTTIPAGAASWDHPITSSNTFYEYPVTIEGNYNYKCTPHQSMGMVGSFTATIVTPTLVSITPNQALQGDTFLATIIGSNTSFSGSPAVTLSFSGNPNEIIIANSVNVLNNIQLEAAFTIPAEASAGNWDVHVDDMALVQGFTVNLFSGIGDPPGILVSTYPNPASDVFFIENATGADVRIYNAGGKNVIIQKITSEKQVIKINQLSPGIYIVRIRMNGNDRIEKLLVN